MNLLRRLFSNKDKYLLVPHEFNFISKLLSDRRYSDAKLYSKYLSEKYIER